MPDAGNFLLQLDHGPLDEVGQGQQNRGADRNGTCAGDDQDLMPLRITQRYCGHQEEQESVQQHEGNGQYGLDLPVDANTRQVRLLAPHGDGSSHPVLHDRTSGLAQPSLLPNMLNIDGVTQGRAMGVRILCTDCHNSDDNREFGGAGANGPHGSKFTHLLERRYEISQAAVPGQAIANLFPNPDLSPFGPYSLCAKCHNLTVILSNTSFPLHAQHISEGFSCSVCHTAHGMGGQSATTTGERLVNFDANVVAPNGTTPISYSRVTNTCSLVCHGHAHK